MSLHPWSADLADLRQHIQVLIEQSAEHKQSLEELVASAGRVDGAAESAASQATRIGVRAHELLRDSAERAANSAVTASQLCRGARQHHQAICELLGQLDAAGAAKS